MNISQMPRMDEFFNMRLMQGQVFSETQIFRKT